MIRETQEVIERVAIPVSQMELYETESTDGRSVVFDLIIFRDILRSFRLWRRAIPATPT
jgi:hypothetical protein